MIVMKFGGTSVGDAARIRAVCEIVAARASRQPIVVVSALAQVTDLIHGAIEAARRGDREGTERALADVERRHRWALAGSIDAASTRHDLALTLDASFEELRQLLRAVRVLGEGTPRAADTLLAFGETLSARILVAALCERGLSAREVDPRRVVVTDARHGCAQPDAAEVQARCAQELLPRVRAGEIPVVGGFVGATRDGVTTTLGRGGSDTTASVLGAAIGAEEIQIWTDVDGILTADPRVVPEARTIERVSFAEAAELAYYGARVLHPASIAPAVRQGIPVRVLNSMRPEAEGTLVLADSPPDAPPIASIASRRGVAAVRVTGGRMRVDPGFFRDVLASFERGGVVPDLIVSSEVAMTVVVEDSPRASGVAQELAARASVEVLSGRAVLCVVGAGLARDPDVRSRVLACLSELAPEITGVGGSATSAAVVVPAERLEESVRRVHRSFFPVGVRA